MDLEHEVAELKQQLSNEQTVHGVLERALHPASARSAVLNIPAFMPSKAKELLAELVLVEEEITRLESQITTMKGGLAAARHQRASAMAVTTTAHSSYPPSAYNNGGTNADRGGMTVNGRTVHAVLASTSGSSRPVAVPTTTAYSYSQSGYTNGGNADRGEGGMSGNGTRVHTPVPTRPINTYSSYPPPSVYITNGNGNADGGRIRGEGGAKMGNGTTVHTAVPTCPYSSYITNDNGNANRARAGGSQMVNSTTVHTPAPTSASTTRYSSYPPCVNHSMTGSQRADQVAPEIKSMFFISQAMNAEYLKRHVSAHDRPTKSPNKDHHTTGSVPAALVNPKFSGNIFALPPRKSCPDKYDRANEKPPKTIQEPSPAKRDDQTKIHPNKLSERIVKCLVVIFIRLLRSSRAAEMEKSGNLARSRNLQGSSFRIDVALNVAAAKEKERGQQDHYGIFAVPDSVVRDIGPYKNLVRFTSSAFDLRGFSCSPLFTKLREMLETLQQVDLRFLTHQQKLAFWLNVYNTCIMHGILQHGLPSDSEKLMALKNKATINVSGQKFSALVIENLILRQPSSVKQEFWKCDVDVEEQHLRRLYGLNSSEPNILFALCCGIRSSPALRIYKAERVMMELEKAKLDYLQASLVVTSTRKLMIPSLIHTNMHDFAKDMESLLRWICDQLPTSWSLRKSMVDCLRGQQGHLKVEDDVVEVIPYDYEFQYLLPI
uniref:Uncharacterized protein n=1 Tax=Avena sativa TaxID=4498 RepID=A0ACD5VY89_AVESA